HRGTSVTVPAENEERHIGTVKGFENGKYRVEVDNKIVEVEENQVQEFVLRMTNRSLFNRIGR
ncbi:hypothetical protein DPV78_001666, partial [Talaromyces pinophilus]